MICVICGEDKPEESLNSDGICLDCLALTIHTEDIYPNEEDLA